MSDLERWREVVDLQLGGWYRETVRSTFAVDGPSGRRDASAAIWYALGFSALHRVAADEVRHHYEGGPVLHLIECPRRHTTVI